jgi:hypothetical protein
MARASKKVYNTLLRLKMAGCPKNVESSWAHHSLVARVQEASITSKIKIRCNFPPFREQ